MTSLDILDTAIKIGLGALISGFGAYLIARLNHDRDVEKARLARRMDSLEEVARYIQNLTRAAQNFYALTHDRAKYYHRDKKVPEACETRWKQARKHLNEAFLETNNAEAVLLLLGEKDSQVLLRKYGEFVAEFFDQAFEPGRCSIGEIEAFKPGLLAMRGELFDNLSAVYKQ